MSVNRRCPIPLRLAGQIALVLVLAACGSLVGPDGVLLGEWGGVHLQMTADSTGARLQYDCATGIIDLPVVVVGGQLHATGSHTPEHGGPIRSDEVLPKLPARYDGELSGTHLTLTVTRTDTGDRLGVFELTKGRPGQVLRCL